MKPAFQPLWMRVFDEVALSQRHITPGISKGYNAGAVNNISYLIETSIMVSNTHRFKYISYGNYGL